MCCSAEGTYLPGIWAETVRSAVHYLRYFKRLAEVGNYTKASQDLFIAQPTLSLAIKRMEEQLGFPLFDRTKNGIRLTESGQVFYEFASRCIDDYETGVRLAQEKQGQISTYTPHGSHHGSECADGEKFFPLEHK